MSKESGQAVSTRKTEQSVENIIDSYVKLLEDNKIPVWRVYLYGSYAKGTYDKNSDIDLAIFLDAESIDGFDEDAKLLKLAKNVDLRIEPHSFARTDINEPDPYIDEIIRTGKRIL